MFISCFGTLAVTLVSDFVGYAIGYENLLKLTVFRWCSVSVSSQQTTLIISGFSFLEHPTLLAPAQINPISSESTILNSLNRIQIKSEILFQFHLRKISF